ncbi:MAG: hypothetical protein R3Y43_08035 [Alphaproteobacteria bacterium]
MIKDVIDLGNDYYQIERDNNSQPLQVLCPGTGSLGSCLLKFSNEKVYIKRDDGWCFMFDENGNSQGSEYIG